MACTWNFRNYIAIPLEHYVFTHAELRRSADSIETGDFVETMLTSLSLLYGSLKEIPEFVEQCTPYENLPASKISPEIATQLFQEFKRLADLRITDSEN